MFARRTGSSELRGKGGWFLREITMIIAYFERKGCVQRNLDLNCVS